MHRSYSDHLRAILVSTREHPGANNMMCLLVMQTGIHGWGLSVRKKLKQDSMVINFWGDLLQLTLDFQAIPERLFQFLLLYELLSCCCSRAFTGGVCSRAKT